MAPRKDTTPPAEETAAAEEATAEPTPVTRVFALAVGAVDADGEPVVRVSSGCSPRVSIGAGERYSTTDPKLADQLATDPHLEETT